MTSLARHLSFRHANRSCRVLVVVATAVEAAPVERFLVRQQRYEAATKVVIVGELAPEVRCPTYRDLGPLILVVTGCDKTNVGHALTLVLESMELPPTLVVQLGIAGAFSPSLQASSPTGRAQGPAVGDVVLATSEMYADTGSSSPQGWLSARELGLPLARVRGLELGGRFPLDSGLVAAAVELVREASAELGVPKLEMMVGPVAGVSVEAHPSVWSGPCVTSSRVTGTRWEAEGIVQRFGALAESMEGAAAAHVCAFYGVPFLEIRGISNLIADRDRTSWEVERAAAVAAWAGRQVLLRLDKLPLGRSRKGDTSPGDTSVKDDLSSSGLNSAHRMERSGG